MDHAQQLNKQNNSAKARLKPVSKTQSKLVESILQSKPNDKNDLNGISISYSALSPDTQRKLWILALDKKSKKINFAGNFNKFNLGFGLNLSGNLSTDIKTNNFNGSIGVNPINKNISLKGSVGEFNFGINGNFQKKSISLNFGIGQPVLPIPQQLSQVFSSSSQSVSNLISSSPKILNDPKKWFNLQQDDILVVKNVVSESTKIMKQNKSSFKNFGAGLNVSYNSQDRFKASFRIVVNF